jgi:hypothetical protein
MTPPARKNGATTTPPPPPTCGFPVGGQAPCGAPAIGQVPWKLLYGYADRDDQLALCAQHVYRFPDVTPL